MNDMKVNMHRKNHQSQSFANRLNSKSQSKRRNNSIYDPSFQKTTLKNSKSFEIKTEYLKMKIPNKRKKKQRDPFSKLL